MQPARTRGAKRDNFLRFYIGQDTMQRHTLVKLIDHSGQTQPLAAKAYMIVLAGCVIAATLSTAIDTIPSIHGHSRPLNLLESVLFGVLFADFALRLAVAAGGADGIRGLKHYLLSLMGLVDFIAGLPFLSSLSGMVERDATTVFGILAFLKLARYSPALVVLKDVIVHERKPLTSALYLMLLLTFSISTMLYFVERDTNQSGFQSIPDAMWWAIVTLSTLGYGDVVPHTALGKILGGIAAILGFGMFALPAGILASGFAEEVKRIRAVTSWNMVAKVPLFAGLEAGVISEISNLLRVRRFIKNEIIIKEGDKGDAMYFILDGEVEIFGKDWRNVLAKGDFFGEIALLKDVPRTASARARSRCECLELTVYNFKQFIASRPELLAMLNEVAERRYSVVKKEPAA
jgi:voltage-gated potassium channel